MDTDYAYRMPFGRFKGQPLEELDDDYLWWLHSLGDLRQPLRDAVDAEFERRKRSQGQDYYRRYGSSDGWNRNGNDKDEGEPPTYHTSGPPELAKELVEAGFKTLARTHHPDVGGTNDGMRQVIEARSWLLQAIEARKLPRSMQR